MLLGCDLLVVFKGQLRSATERKGLGTEGENVEKCDKNNSSGHIYPVVLVQKTVQDSSESYFFSSSTVSSGFAPSRILNPTQPMPSVM